MSFQRYMEAWRCYFKRGAIAEFKGLNAGRVVGVACPEEPKGTSQSKVEGGCWTTFRNFQKKAHWTQKVHQQDFLFCSPTKCKITGFLRAWPL